jgi:hypothetical protein
MALAVMGQRSWVTSYVFQYFIPQANVAYVNAAIGQITEQVEFLAETIYINQCLDTLVEAVDGNNKDVEAMDGTAIFKIKADKNRIVPLSQSESCDNRGPSFMDFSQM